MNTTVTDEQVQQLAATAKPYSLGLLWWGPDRYKDGAEATELEHQRRMVSLRADGVIAILCPVGSDTLAGGMMRCRSTRATASQEMPCPRGQRHDDPSLASRTAPGPLHGDGGESVIG